MSLPRTWTALITPFSNDQVDLDGLCQNINEQIRKGIEGILVLGTTGETPTLTQEEKRLVIETAVDTANRRVPVMVGTGTNSTATTIEQTLEAEKLGADIALIVTPYYNRPTQEGIYAHFSAVCDKTNIPICLYNIPKRTGQVIENQTLVRLASLPKIIGNKDATGNLSAMAAFHKALPGFPIWCGDDPLILPMMALGAVGTISVASNILPEEIFHIVQLASNDRFLEAKDLFYEISPLIDALSLEVNPIPIKAAMDIEGKPAGPCRLPMTPPSETTLRALQQNLEQLKTQVV